MAYAGDRMYNEVIRKKMGDLATKVKAKEIIAHLPCLTISDREEIEAKRDNTGNYNAMMLLLENLRRRENWPDQFISALQACEQWTLAKELSEAYDRIRGIHNQRTSTPATSAPVPPAAAASVNPAAPPAPAPAPSPAPAAAAPSPAPSPAAASAAVTMATIHNVPHSTPHLLTPSLEASALSAPSSVNSHPGPHSNIAAPASTEAPALVLAPNVPVHPAPVSAHPAEPPLVGLAPDARPPSPVSAPMLTPSPGQNEVFAREMSKMGTSEASAHINSPPESCSNIASPVLTEAPALVSALGASLQPPHEPAQSTEPQGSVLAPHAQPPSPVSAPKVAPSLGQSEVPVSSLETPTLAISHGLTNTAFSRPSPVTAPTLPINPTSSNVNKPATTSQSFASPKKSSVPVGVQGISSSVKHPVQETNTPGNVLPQDSQNNQIVSQVPERVHIAVPPQCQTQETSQETAQASSSVSTDGVAGYLSNSAAENEECFSKPGMLREEEPFSATSDCLQISHMTMAHSPVQLARPQAVSTPHRAEELVNEPASVTTDDLMISSSTTACPSQFVSDPMAPVPNSTPRALENGFSEGDSNSYPHQPVEDHYESVRSESGIREHFVEFSERPSIQNLNGQPPSMVGPTTIGLSHNGETESLVQSVPENQPASEQANPAAVLTACAEPASATFQSELNTSGQINLPQLEQREASQGVLHQIQSNAHLIAAAAIGMTAVFVALKYKY